MARFRVLKAKALKKMVESIWTISNQALIAFSPDEVRISLSDENTELDALLIITAKGFFDEYDCKKSLVIRVDSLQLSLILSFAEDDDQISVEFKDDSPVSLLEIHIHDSSNNEKRVEKLEAPEILNENLVHEETDYDFEAAVKSECFRKAVLHSAEIEQPLTITVTDTSLTLASGDESIELNETGESACELENTPLHHELELYLYRHSGTFSIASNLSEKVKVIASTDASASPPPPSLEFPISEFSKLCFYFPKHSSRNVVFLKVLTAKMFKQMVKSISTISNEALIEFSENEVVISAENSKKNVNALLKIAPPFFHEYHCRRSLVTMVDYRKLAIILISLKDDDQVCIFVKDENPITCLRFHIQDSKNRRNKTAQMEAAETVAKKLDIDESLYEYEVGMSPLHFGNIVAHSARFKDPITIFVTSISVTLITGSHSAILLKENESECELDKVRGPTQLPLQLSLHPHAQAFVTACRIADIVKLRDWYGTSRGGPPLLLEFPIGAFCKVLFYFSFRFYA